MAETCTLGNSTSFVLGGCIVTGVIFIWHSIFTPGWTCIYKTVKQLIWMVTGGMFIKRKAQGNVYLVIAKTNSS